MKSVVKSDVLMEIDEKLLRLKSIKMEIEDIKKEADEQMEKMKSEYAKRVQPLKGELDMLDKEIKSLMKQRRKEVFGEGDIVKTENGILYYKVRQVVRKARGVTVELLKKLGYFDGIRVEEHVNWPAIEKWPEEKLIAIGTERTEKEDFGYELKGAR